MVILMVVLAISLTFLAVFFGALWSGKTDFDINKRLKEYHSPERVNSKTGFLNSKREFPEKVKFKSFREIVAQYGKKIEVIQLTQKIQLELEKGDIPLRGYEFLLIVCGLTIGLVVAAFIWNRNGLSMGAAGILGITGSFMYLRIRQKQKVVKFNNQIGDAIVMVSNSLKSGYAFIQAIDLVAKEMMPPVNNEFAKVIQEMNLGLTTEDALMRLTERVCSSDLDLVVTAMLIQRQIGGNLAEILDNISETIRERIRIKNEVKALTAQGRLSGLIIGIMPIGLGLFLLLINPKYISQLVTDPRGLFMLEYAAVAELIAVLIIRKIITIKV